MTEKEEIIIDLLDVNKEVQKNTELLENDGFKLESEFQSECNGHLLLDSYFKKDDRLVDLVVTFSNDAASFDKLENLDIKEVYLEEM